MGLWLAILFFGNHVLYDRCFSFGIAVGGGLALVNLLFFAKVAKEMLDPNHSKAKMWGLIGGAKFFFLLLFVWWILKNNHASGLSFAIGYLSMPLGIVTANTILPKSSPPSDKNML